jgi:hypothetical protein
MVATMAFALIAGSAASHAQSDAHRGGSNPAAAETVAPVRVAALNDMRTRSGGKIIEAVNAVLLKRIAGYDGVLIVQFGNFYVQCLNADWQPQLLCEAASTYSEPWMKYALTPNHVALLAKLGFEPPGVTANFAIRLPRETSAAMVSDMILTVITSVYGQGGEDADVIAAILARNLERPRRKLGQDRGGEWLVD